jgi:hypothetical protein
LRIYFISLLLLLVIHFGGFSAYAELDLQESNVTKVEYTKLSDETYRFDVTIFHDDDGEDGYADYWQVETVEGSVLGTRILTHAHSTAEFTRSAEIVISSNIQIVIVRGHDQTHGFGGQVIAIDMQNGEQQIIDQGPNKVNFSNFEFNFHSSDTLITSDTQIQNTAEISNNNSSPFLFLSGAIGFSVVYQFKFRWKGKNR